MQLDLIAPASPAPTLAAARERIAAVDPAAYARTRNALTGAVSGLSPYITHGFVSLRDVLEGVAARHALDLQHKWVYELGWRAFHHHVWQLRGEDIFQSLHEGVLPEAAYAPVLPQDIREARTGVPVIDQAVRTLYKTGGLHNHARMWLASYVVHVRKVHWRAGADWLYSHLLDGDLASNHLSWQWVAATGSTKPYLFNAENVARYAPADWHSPGSIIDASYEALERLARQVAPPGGPQQCEPSSPAAGATQEPALLIVPPSDLGFQAPDAGLVAGRDVWLVHPWSLGELPSAVPADTRVVGIAMAEVHRRWPWSERRWCFVGARMGELAPLRWFGDANALQAGLAGARSVHIVADPHLKPWLDTTLASSLRVRLKVHPAPALFPTVQRLCPSFSQWWRLALRGMSSVDELLAQSVDPVSRSLNFTPGTSP